MIICIVGPTGVGKTKLSIELAKRLNGEVINADSTQVYKGLDIATAKVKEKEKEGIVHHLFDIKNIDEDYTVYDYQKDCRNKIEDIINRGKTPIMVGGTGLYIKASLYDYNFKEETKKRDYSNYSNFELYNLLKSIDSNTDIHVNNRKRIERALDYYYEHNELISNNKTDKILYDVVFIGLTTDRDILYERINNRVDKMIKDGLLLEARKIYDSKIRSKAVMTPIGYKELFPYFDGVMELNECIDLMKRNSRRYAKRQYTWFNNQMNVKWFNVDFNNFSYTVNEIMDFIERN